MIEYFDVPRQRIIFEVLEKYRTVEKCADENGFICTGFSGASDATVDQLTNKLKAGVPLACEEAKILVRVVDFMVLMLPDLQDIPWDGELHTIASKMRQYYFKDCGEKAYE